MIIYNNDKMLKLQDCQLSNSLLTPNSIRSTVPSAKQIQFSLEKQYKEIRKKYAALLVPGCPKHPHTFFHICIDWFPERK